MTDDDKAAYREKLRSIGFDRGHRTRTTDVRDERTGSTAGTQTEHRDGRVDATVRAPAVVVKTTSHEAR